MLLSARNRNSAPMLPAFWNSGFAGIWITSTPKAQGPFQQHVYKLVDLACLLTAHGAMFDHPHIKVATVGARHALGGESIPN